MVILAVMPLGEGAYGVPICREIEEQAGREVGLGAFMPPSNALRKRGLCLLNWASQRRNAVVEQRDSFASRLLASAKFVRRSGH
jgi:hypothetical protein